METIRANYKIFPEKAASIETAGTNFYNEIKSAYDQLTSLNDVWKGVRYIDLAKSFNNLVADLNTIIEDVSTDIPTTLRTIASNYGNFDMGSFSAGSTGTASKISELNVPSDDAIYFDFPSVDSARTAIAEKFTESKTYITEAKNIVSGMLDNGDWAGQAANSAMDKLTNYESKINSSLDDLIDEFKTAMDKTVEDITKAENANTAS